MTYTDMRGKVFGDLPDVGADEERVAVGMLVERNHAGDKLIQLLLLLRLGVRRPSCSCANKKQSALAYFDPKRKRRRTFSQSLAEPSEVALEEFALTGDGERRRRDELGEAVLEFPDGIVHDLIRLKISAALKRKEGSSVP